MTLFSSARHRGRKPRGRQLFVAAATGTLLVATPLAFADTLLADGDEVSGEEAVLNVGEICVGQGASGSVGLTLDRGGNAGPNVWANSASVAITATASGAIKGSASASGLNAQTPSNWVTGTPSADNDKYVDAGDSTITVNVAAGTAPGAGSATVTYTASGAGVQGGTVTKSDTVAVSWTVVNCTPTDTTPPTIGYTLTPSTPNANGWFNQDVTVTFACADEVGGSGLKSCSDAVTLVEGAAQTVTGYAEDNAGNTSSVTTEEISIDKTAPTVSLVGGPQNGAEYYFGSVPGAPICSASDALSGLDGACSVSGYATTVGTHTVSASAADKAGNSSSASATYTVKAWTLTGFYAPVDMNGVYNTVKGGSTVPLKFEVFAEHELTDSSVVQSFAATKIACPGATATEDAIEFLTTGGTSLRYDAAAGQFIQNWKTPTGANTCYRVTMTTQDGSTLQALFKIK